MGHGRAMLSEQFIHTIFGIAAYLRARTQTDAKLSADRPRFTTQLFSGSRLA
jgi:hypothetical protein